MPFSKPSCPLRVIALAFVVLASASASADTFDASFSTFLGSRYDAGYDSVESITTDADGNVYIGGQTQSDTSRPDEPGIPTTPSSLRLPSNQAPDNPCQFGCGYVVKLTPDQDVVYGAILPEVRVQEIAVAADGAVVFAGPYGDFIFDPPTTPGAFSSEGNMFVGKVSADGSALEFGAVFDADEIHGLALDADGNIYLAGDSIFGNVVTTPDAIKPEPTTAGELTPSNGFLLKISPTGTELIFGTYLGGDGTDESLGLALDGAGGALVVGRSNSSSLFGFPARTTGVDDAYIVHVSSDGTQVLDFAYFGGSDGDLAEAIEPSPLGGYTLVGRTSSVDLPVSPGALQDQLIGSANGWIASVDSDLNVTGATYFGGTFTDGILDLSLDEAGNAYFVGTTFSADMLTSEDGFQSLSSAYTTSFYSNAGRDIYPVDSDLVREAFFGVVSADMDTLVYGSYLGGSLTVPRGFEALTFGSTITRSQNGAVYVGGVTGAESFPTNSDALQDGFLGLFDGFVVEFSAGDLEITSPMSLPVAPVETGYEYRLEATGGVPPYTWRVAGFKLPEGLQLSPDGVISGLTGNNQTEVTAYQFTVEVTDSTGNSAHKNLFIKPLPEGNPNCEAGQCRLELDVPGSFIFPLPFPARGLPPFTLDVIGELPAGVEVNEADGTFAGSFDGTGSYTFGFTVTGSSGVSSTLNWQIAVTSPNQPPPTNAPPTSGGGSGGGGGALALFEVLFIALVLVGSGLHGKTKSNRSRGSYGDRMRRIPNSCNT